MQICNVPFFWWSSWDRCRHVHLIQFCVITVKKLGTIISVKQCRFFHLSQFRTVIIWKLKRTRFAPCCASDKLLESADPPENELLVVFFISTYSNSTNCYVKLTSKPSQRRRKQRQLHSMMVKQITDGLHPVLRHQVARWRHQLQSPSVSGAR